MKLVQTDYNLSCIRWLPFPSLPYRTDGHKMVLVEGIPTVFSWERIERFDGTKWVEATDGGRGKEDEDETRLKLMRSRSHFTVTTVPGHLVPKCAVL
jgi:hypothetical protein